MYFSGISTTLSGSAVVRIPKVRPPEKKKYEEEMEVLTNTIKGKETQLVSFGDNCGLVSGTACIENRYSCKKNCT